MEQAHQVGFDGGVVRRWFVVTEDGRRLVRWGETQEIVIRKAESRGDRVSAVLPAGWPL